MRRDIVPRFERGERLGAGKLNQLSEAAAMNLTDQSAYQDETGQYCAPPTLDIEPVRFCSAQNHPGRKAKFNIYVGVWDPDIDDWTYPGCDTGDVDVAKDWFYSDPAIEPTAGFGGWGFWMPSNTTDKGRILVVWQTDCDSYPECCD